MPVFGVEAKECKEVINFVIETNKRLKEENLVKSPFNGMVVNKGDFLAVLIEPIYINLPFYISLIGATFSIILNIRSILYFAILSIFILLNIFWTSYFYYFLFTKGLKKNGYKGKLKYIGAKELAKRLITWDKEKY